MRVLTSVGVCSESSKDTYQSNELSQIGASTGGKAGIKITLAFQFVPFNRLRAILYDLEISR